MCIHTQKCWQLTWGHPTLKIMNGRPRVARDGKMYKRASNGCVNFFIVWVKFIVNSMLFCCESELCHDFVLFGVILLFFFVFYLVCFLLLLYKKEKINFDITVSSIVVWRSHFAPSCCQIYLTQFCQKFTFVVINAPIIQAI